MVKISITMQIACYAIKTIEESVIMSIYLNDFTCLEDVRSNFSIDSSDLEGVTILVANYTYENYDGSAFVLFEKAGKLYEVYGGHCSCYGLEGQWEPEEVLLDELIKRVETSKYQFQGCEHEVVEILSLIQKIGIDATIVSMKLMGQ